MAAYNNDDIDMSQLNNPSSTLKIVSEYDQEIP